MFVIIWYVCYCNMFLQQVHMYFISQVGCWCQSSMAQCSTLHESPSSLDTGFNHQNYQWNLLEGVSGPHSGTRKVTVMEPVHQKQRQETLQHTHTNTHTQREKGSDSNPVTLAVVRILAVPLILLVCHEYLFDFRFQLVLALYLPRYR